MGGNALKNTPTQRLGWTDYEQVSRQVAIGLQQAFPGARVKVIPSYFSKTNFGDLDILVTSDGVHANGGGETLKAVALDVFHARELFKNGNVLSFDYRASADQVEPGFQVDVITMPESSFDFALAYFSFNDLGNLIGRTAHKQGASFGHDGLWYYFRDGDYKFREVLLTRDHDLALRFLGYDPSRFHQGFEDLESIFQYVSGSAFFNRSIFLLDNRNHTARVRDRKRKTYTEFLDWCEARPDLPAFQYPEDKAQWLPRMFEYFPAFLDEYDLAVRDLATQRAVRERFNGGIVAALTGLRGKDLGILMRTIKESFESGEALNEFVLQSTDDELRQRVLDLQLQLQSVQTAN